MFLYKSLWIYVFNSLWWIPRTEMLRQWMFTFMRTARAFSKVAVQFHTPTNNLWDFLLFCTFVNIFYLVVSFWSINSYYPVRKLLRRRGPHRGCWQTFLFTFPFLIPQSGEKSCRQLGPGGPTWTRISLDWKCRRMRPRKLSQKPSWAPILLRSCLYPSNVNNQTIGMDVIINNYTNYCWLRGS